MFTRRELEYLLQSLESTSRASARSHRSSGRPPAFERAPGISDKLVDLLVEWFNSLSPDQKRDFFQLRTAYEKIGFLARCRINRESEDRGESH